MAKCKLPKSSQVIWYKCHYCDLPKGSVHWEILNEKYELIKEGVCL